MLKIENFLSLHFPKDKREIFKSWKFGIKRKIRLQTFFNISKAEIPTQKEGRKINVFKDIKNSIFSMIDISLAKR